MRTRELAAHMISGPELPNSGFAPRPHENDASESFLYFLVKGTIAAGDASQGDNFETMEVDGVGPTMAESIA